MPDGLTIRRRSAQVRAAELKRKAASAGHYPSLDVNANFGDIGINPSQSNGTWQVNGGINIPVFAGNRVHGDVLQADAQLKQARSQLGDLRGRIDYEVRTALLDLNAAAEQVAVAQSSVELAEQALTQSQDRFSAGVADNLEVVQAQESVAGAHESYIQSLYAHNLAKVELAYAIGDAEARCQALLERQSIILWSKPQRRLPLSELKNRNLATKPLPATERDFHTRPTRTQSPGFRIAILIALIVLVVIGFFVYRYLTSYESTDDAQVDGHINSISARVSGHVIKLNIRDNQYVNAGDVLVEIDPTDYQVALDHAKADFADAEAAAVAAGVTVPITSVNTSSQVTASQADVNNSRAGIQVAQQQLQAAKAQLQQAQANDVKAQNDLGRYKQLVTKRRSRNSNTIRQWRPLKPAPPG